MVKNSKAIALGCAVLVALMLLVGYVITAHHSDDDTTSTVTIEQCINMLTAQHPEADAADVLTACDEVTK